MSILIGSTGFIGRHLQSTTEFNKTFHKSDIHKIKGSETNLLVCAGLPAEKWKANQDPASDWLNTIKLAQLLSTVKTDRAVLISTIDVYQPAINVTENDSPNLEGKDAYGRNRAWFEVFFKSNFENSIILRLPGVFGINLKKNFIFDLLNNQENHISTINQKSTFQFFNINRLSVLIQMTLNSEIKTLNISSVPIFAQEIADLFGVKLHTTASLINYDMQTVHHKKFCGNDRYLYGKEEILRDIDQLRLNYSRR